MKEFDKNSLPSLAIENEAIPLPYIVYENNIIIGFIIKDSKNKSYSFFKSGDEIILSKNLFFLVRIMLDAGFKIHYQIEKEVITKLAPTDEDIQL